MQHAINIHFLLSPNAGCCFLSSKRTSPHPFPSLHPPHDSPAPPLLSPLSCASFPPPSLIPFLLSLTSSPSLSPPSSPPLRSSLLVTVCGIKAALWFAHKLIIVTDREFAVFQREGSRKKSSTHAVFLQHRCGCFGLLAVWQLNNCPV